MEKYDIKIIDLKCQVPCRMKSMNYLMNHILYQIFKIISSTESHLKLNNIYHFKLLTPDTIKLFGSTRSKITKDGNGENVLKLEITEITLV